MVVSPQTRGFYSLHSWCTLFMVLGYRLSPLMCILPPSEILMLLFGVLMGDTSLIHCCSSKAPKAIGHCHRVRITWKTSFLFSASSEHPWVGCCRGPAIPTSAANRNLAYSWEHSKESQAQAGAWNPLGWGAAPTGLQNQPSGKCRASLRSFHVHSSVLGATQLCFVFSLGISSLPPLSTILPWNHDYRYFLCRCLPGGCSSPPYRVACSLGWAGPCCGILSRDTLGTLAQSAFSFTAATTFTGSLLCQKIVEAPY